LRSFAPSKTPSGSFERGGERERRAPKKTVIQRPSESTEANNRHGSIACQPRGSEVCAGRARDFLRCCASPSQACALLKTVRPTARLQKPGYVPARLEELFHRVFDPLPQGLRPITPRVFDPLRRCSRRPVVASRIAPRSLRIGMSAIVSQ